MRGRTAPKQKAEAHKLLFRVLTGITCDVIETAMVSESISSSDSDHETAPPSLWRRGIIPSHHQRSFSHEVFDQPSSDTYVVLAINGFEVHVSADEDGILAQIEKGNILQTETCFGWNDKTR